MAAGAAPSMFAIMMIDANDWTTLAVVAILIGFALVVILAAFNAMRGRAAIEPDPELSTHHAIPQAEQRARSQADERFIAELRKSNDE